MRINAYNVISQIYQPKKPKGVRSTGSPTEIRDELQISSFGREFQIAKQAVAEASDIREDKVAEMTKKYSGRVTVDTGNFADVLLEKYRSIA